MPISSASSRSRAVIGIIPLLPTPTLQEKSVIFTYSSLFPTIGYVPSIYGIYIQRGRGGIENSLKPPPRLKSEKKLNSLRPSHYLCEAFLKKRTQSVSY